MKVASVMIIFLTIVFNYGCSHEVDTYFDDIFQAVKMAQNENKYVIVSRSAEDCHLCKINETVLEDVKKNCDRNKFIFGKIIYNSIVCDEPGLITKQIGVPCSFVISNKGNIASIITGN